MTPPSIDVHNHIYTRSHLSAIREYGSASGWSIQVNPKTGGEMLYGERGYPFAITKPCYDMDERIKALDASKISFQIMSPSEPFFDFVSPKEGAKLAKKVNDEICETVEQYPTRFAGLAGLSLGDTDAALDEAKRATRDRGLKGIIVPTKVNGDLSIASPNFDAFWKEIDSLSLSVFIHPTLPKGAELYKEYYLGMMVVYPSETSVTIAQMIFRGILDKCSRMKIMVADLGGPLPIIAGRMFRFYSAIEATRKDVKNEPLEYLKRIYYENGSEYLKASMDCCLALAGAEHMLLGTNYPSPIGQLSDALGSIDKLDVTGEEKELILYRNARELFSLDQI